MPEDRAARLEQRAVALFYLFLRDLMPVGALTEYVERISQEEKFDFSSRPLESVARDLVDRLGRPAGEPVMSKAVSEFVEKLPARTQRSPELAGVLAELDGGLHDDRTRAAVVREVAERERARVRPAGG